jgi:hypothetical protein
MQDQEEGASLVEPETTAPLRRARRFDLRVPIRYRRLGEEEWREGRTENISRSGILFRPPGPVELDTSLEMRFELPAGRFLPEVVCRGRVVRAILSRSRSASLIAATIAEYRLLPTRA